MEPLRPYQAELIEATRQSLRAGHQRPLLVAPTGSGKTRIAAEIIKLADQKRKWTLFLAPRRELIYQSSATLLRHGIESGLIMAGESRDLYARHQVASFDTLYARAVRSEKILMPQADLVIVDEAHLSLAPTRKHIIDSYPDAIICGLTATPARGDGRGLGLLYDDLLQSWSISRLMEAGYLVPRIRYFAGEAPDLSDVPEHGGDYVVSGPNGIGEAVDKPKLIGDIVDNWFRLAHDRQTVVFCAVRKHSRHVCQEFVKRGIKAEHLDGETPTEERRAILERVARQETQVLCNVFVASYGLDIPSLECCVLARPTKNITLYLQTVGRVLRTWPGKEEALVIDHAGAIEENGYVEDDIPWSLECDSRVKDRKKEKQEQKGEPKEIKCMKCGAVFKSRRDCPECGHAMVPPSEPIPVHQADLVEVQRKQDKENREASWEEKIDFIGQLRAYARAKGKKEGWINHTYRHKFGVWPNDRRVKGAPEKPLTDSVLSYIKHRNIAYAKSKERAA